MNPRPGGGRRIAWQSVITVISAAILIGAEVFGAAFAGGWAVASYSELVPAFRALLAQKGGDLPVFYAAVRELAKLDKSERDARLTALGR